MFASFAANADTKMTNEPKGPYKPSDIFITPNDCHLQLNADTADLANSAWLNGRASRGGLREALEKMLDIETDEEMEAVALARKALAEDEKTK